MAWACGHAVGDRDELDVERADGDALAVEHRAQLGATEQAGLLDAVAGEPERERRAVDRHADLAQQVLQRADVVLVAVGGDDGDDPRGVLAQVREVGQHEVDAVHVGVGEHQPAVDEQDAAVGPVADRPPPTSIAMQLRPISPSPPRKTTRTASRASAGTAAAGAGRSGLATGGDQRLVDVGGPRVEPRRVGVHRRAAAGRPAGRGGAASPWSGRGSAHSSPVSNCQLSSRRALTRDGRGDVAALPARRTSRPRRARTQWVATPIEPDGADGEQRQRHRVVAAVDLEVAGRGRDHRGRVGRVPGGVLDADDVGHLVGEAHEHVGWRSCGRCGSGCRRRSPAASVAAATARRWASMPACDGRL